MSEVVVAYNAQNHKERARGTQKETSEHYHRRLLPLAYPWMVACDLIAN